MATPAVTVSDVSGDNSCVLAATTLTTADNTSAIIRYPEHEKKSIQATGTFGGATVVLEGSNDGVNFFTLTNKAGTALAITAAGLSDCDANCIFTRARLSVVGAGASVIVSALLRAPSTRYGQLT